MQKKKKKKIGVGGGGGGAGVNEFKFGTFIGVFSDGTASMPVKGLNCFERTVYCGAHSSVLLIQYNTSVVII